MHRSKSIRPKSPRLLEREIKQALSRPAHATRESGGAWLPWKGQRVRIDPSPRTIKPFELDRPYVVRHHGKLYTIVSDVWAGNSAHPATVEGPTKARAHATKRSDKAAKGTDKINIDQLAKMFGLPDWDKIDEMNQQHYWEMARGAEDEDAQIAAESAAQDEVYGQWYDAVESVGSQLFGEHGLDLQPTGKQGTATRRYEFKIVPQKSWNDAADKLRETINGVGYFHFNTLKEFLDSGPYTARSAVLSHLNHIKSYPAVYGSGSAHDMYERAWR